MNKIVGLKFMLEGHFLGVFLTVEEASEILRRWTSSEYTLRDVQVIGGVSQPVPGVPAVTWALKVDKILGIHTFSLEEVQQMQAVQQGGQHRPNWPPLGLSGGRN